MQNKTTLRAVDRIFDKGQLIEANQPNFIHVNVFFAKYFGVLGGFITKNPRLSTEGI